LLKHKLKTPESAGIDEIRCIINIKKKRTASLRKGKQNHFLISTYLLGKAKKKNIKKKMPIKKEKLPIRKSYPQARFEQFSSRRELISRLF